MLDFNGNHGIIIITGNKFDTPLLTSQVFRKVKPEIKAESHNLSCLM